MIIVLPVGPSRQSVLGALLADIDAGTFDPIPWQDVEDAIYWFFKHSSGLEVIWADQKAPRRNYPYGSLRIIAGPTVQGIDELRRPETSISPKMTACGPRQITASFKILGKPADIKPAEHARKFSGRVMACIELPRMRAILQNGGVSVIKTTPIQLPDEQVADTWISRSVIDMQLGLSSNVTQDIPIIETVNVVEV